MSLVSVIIPTYNSVGYIEAAINSVLQQNYRPLEIVVIDDGSTDNTRDALEPLIKSGAIRYYYKSNGGASSARNFGITKAKGDFIGFLDADDLFLPGMLSICIDRLAEGGSDLVSVDNYMVYLANGKEIRKELYAYQWIEKASQDLFCTFMKVGGIGGPHKTVFRRSVFELVGYFDTSLEVYEDLDFWIRIAQKQLDWKHVRKPLVQCHRGINGSLFTKDVKLNLDCRLRVLRRYKKDALNICPEINRELSQQLWDMGRSYIRIYHCYRTGFSCLAESFVLFPSLKRVVKSFFNFIMKE